MDVFASAEIASAIAASHASLKACTANFILSTRNSSSTSMLRSAHSAPLSSTNSVTMLPRYFLNFPKDLLMPLSVIVIDVFPAK